jgi:hypothetical protein
VAKPVEEVSAVAPTPVQPPAPKLETLEMQPAGAGNVATAEKKAAGAEDGEKKTKYSAEELAKKKEIARAYREKRLKEIDAQGGPKA